MNNNYFVKLHLKGTNIIACKTKEKTRYYVQSIIIYLRTHKLKIILLLFNHTIHDYMRTMAAKTYLLIQKIFGFWDIMDFTSTKIAQIISSKTKNWRQ